MASSFLSTAVCSPASSSSSSATAASVYHLKNNVRRQTTLCKNLADHPPPCLTKRSLSICLITGFVSLVRGEDYPRAFAAILEADDDEALLEKVKKDRKKRLEKQGIISSSSKETGYVQDLVYRLSKIGQAIENNDLSAAGSVLGSSADTDWVRKANIAFNKLSSSAEEKTEVDAFNSSLASLISSVTRKDIESSKIAFVASASALEKWTSLTGLVEQLKGL